VSVEYAIIVKNKTRLEVLIDRFNTKAQAKFYIERSGGNFDDYEQEHAVFHDSLSLVVRELSRVIKNKLVERTYLPSFLFNDKQVVVVVGQDGLVANAAKYVNGIPIVAVNPDAARYDGVLLPFSPAACTAAVEKVMSGQQKSKTVSLAEVQLNDGQRLLAFNDLFIGAASHISARYKIAYQGNTEEHSSSGIIVSTLSGSTGWMSSVFNMAYGVHHYIEKGQEKAKRLRLKEDQLLFAVREPFASKKTQTGIAAGILTPSVKLVIESYMPVNGVIFSDGIEADFLKFNAGSIATIGIAAEKAHLVMPA
jgi:NAD kinase